MSVSHQNISRSFYPYQNLTRPFERELSFSGQMTIFSLIKHKMLEENLVKIFKFFEELSSCPNFTKLVQTVLCGPQFFVIRSRYCQETTFYSVYFIINLDFLLLNSILFKNQHMIISGNFQFTFALFLKAGIFSVRCLFMRTVEF